MFIRRYSLVLTLAASFSFGLPAASQAQSQTQPQAPAAAGAQIQTLYRLDPAYPNLPMAGPAHAKGAVIWSHGRSTTSEDSLSPTPTYMTVLRKAGWDIYRFNRMRDGDTLPDSARVLAQDVEQLKQQGYQKIVLAGQSFGAFLSLMAADANSDVHAVIATAPAAFGSFSDFYGSWQQNAARLYPLLDRVQSARVMLFFFHGDDFDPGGRGEKAKAILGALNIDSLVVDQPPELTGHWASTTQLFVRRFGDCIRDFIEAGEGAQISCSSNWGIAPTDQIAFTTQFHTHMAGVGASGGGNAAKAPRLAGAQTTVQ